MKDNTITIDASHPTIAALIAKQGDMSDKKFANKYLITAHLGKVSETVWFRLKKGYYKVADYSELIAKLEACLAQIHDQEVIMADRKERSVEALTNVRVGITSVNRAFNQVRDRLCVILTPTGGGKSTIAKAVKMKFTNSVIVEATETWRKSYIASMQAIGLSLGLTNMSSCSRLAEHELFSELKLHQRIIIIDEGNYFGKESLNLVKAILNKTECIVLILAMPELWQVMKKKTMSETAQLRTRTVSFVELTSITATDVETLLTKNVGDLSKLNGSKSKCISMVTNAANSFGLYNTVMKIIDEIKKDELSEENVKQAIDNVRKLTN